MEAEKKVGKEMLQSCRKLTEKNLGAIFNGLARSSVKSQIGLRNNANKLA